MSQVTIIMKVLGVDGSLTHSRRYSVKNTHAHARTRTHACQASRGHILGELYIQPDTFVTLHDARQVVELAHAKISSWASPTEFRFLCLRVSRTRPIDLVPDGNLRTATARGYETHIPKYLYIKNEYFHQG